MFELNIYEMANYIMDGTALFILVGMTIYTFLFRRRGRPADKVFFAMILMMTVYLIYAHLFAIVRICVFSIVVSFLLFRKKELDF